MNILNLRSPAKINLFLEVINKRKDGYHNIKTLFERINLFDDIRLRKRRDGNIRVFCSHPDVPTDKSNLAYKAAELLKKDFSGTAGVDIYIRKRTPVAAGLGGGSSNAATVLQGLNRLWQLRLSKIKLMEYAARIGSDAPFFIENKSFALGSGRGDEIKSLSGLPKLWHIVVVPKLKIYTKDIYHGLNFKLTKPRLGVNMLIYALKNFDKILLKKSIFNALEYRVLRREPLISQIKDKLKSLGVEEVSLSGSGPAVFGLVNSRKEAEAIQKRLKEQSNWQAFVVRTF